MTEKTLLGHPIGLFVLFFTEMWERFSYYGMRSLLILYLTESLIQAAQAQHPVFGYQYLQAGLETLYGPLTNQALASQIYGLYSGLVYLTPLFGGILADRLFGQRKMVIIGGLLMAIGHFLMASEQFFFIALLFLIMGSGCFKPNISTQVGSLYVDGDPRRDGAFTIFYMGINLGAFFSPLVCGTLGQRFGWHYGFGAAGIGMLIGLGIYSYGQKYLPTNNFKPINQAEIAKTPLTGKQWQALAGLLTLATLNIVFWAVYEQQGNTLQLFVEHHTNREIFGWEAPSSWFQSLNPAFIFLLAPLLDRLSARLTSKQADLSSIGKMALGCLLLGASFLVLILAISGVQDSDKISFMWLVLCALIYTLGELYLSPIGLSLVTKISPPQLVSMVMGIWFLSSFFGNYLSGYIGGFYETMPKSSFFLLLAGLGMTTGLAIWALKSPLKKAIGVD